MEEEPIKRSRTHTKELKPVKLYLDDIEHLYNILAEVSSTITLETNEYKVRSPKQLQGLQQGVIRELEMKSSEPYISLTLRPFHSRLYCGSDDAAAYGTFIKMKQVLYKHSRRFHQLWFNPILPTILFGLLFIAVELDKGQKRLTSILLTCIIVAVVWFIASLFFRMKQYSTIILTYRNSTPSFVKRNKDNIILVMVSALLGGVVTYIVTILTQTSP